MVLALSGLVQILRLYNNLICILDSEQRDECIDFTMMCVPTYISNQNNALIFNLNNFFGRK